MKTAQRQTNFELLRLVSMFLIVLGHCIMHGLRDITSSTVPDLGINPASTVDLINFCASQLLGYLANVGVNLFVLITGYFTIRPRDLRGVATKAFRLWRKIAFYCVLILAASCQLHHKIPFIYEAFTALTPIYHNTYWFMTQYMALLLLSPFIARLLSALDKKDFGLLLLVMLLLNFQQESFGYGGIFSGGMSLMFFVFLFCIGNYIRRFNPLEKYQKYGWIVYLAICIGMTILGVSLQLINLGKAGHEFLYIKGLANNSLPLFSAIALFLWFKNVHIGDGWFSRIILKTSPYVFGVYLLHDNPMVRELLWSKVPNYIHQAWFIPAVLMYVTVVFFLCLMIDKILSKLVK